MESKASPYIIALGVAWGFNLVLSRFGISQFDPFVFIGLRLAIAVVVFAAIILFSAQRRWSRDPQLWRKATIVGVFGTAVPFIGFVGALQYQSAGLTSLLVTTAPAITVTVAHFLLPEARLNRATIIGVLVALGGAVLIVARGENGLPSVAETNPIAYLLVFGALVVDAFIAVFIRKNMQGYDTFEVTSIRMLTAMIMILPLAYWLNPPDFGQITAAGWGVLFFTAIVSTVFAQLLAFYIARTFGTTAIALVSYVVPLVAIVSGIVLLGETLTIGMIVGMMLIVSGILIVNRRKSHA